MGTVIKRSAYDEVGADQCWRNPGLQIGSLADL